MLGDVYEAEVKIKHAFESHWDQLPTDVGQFGVLDVVSMHAWHWLLRGEAKLQYERVTDEPEDRYLRNNCRAYCM